MEAERIAREKLGFNSLRKGQRDAIDSIVNHRDTLLVQPTGSGKSAVYQIAGMMLDGPTVIVSPLIALQKDQKDSIEDCDGLAEAAVLNSTLKVGELRDVLAKLDQGDLEFLFLAPEQIQKPDILARILASKPSLFVVDEAHCISEWGHDFRPDYLKLSSAIEALGHPAVLAMTATASPIIRDEISARLGMRDPLVIVRGFDRPNIWLGTRQFSTEDEKTAAVIAAVAEEQKPGIVYVATRKHAEQLAAAFTERGMKVSFYHGGMRAKEREQIQNDFMTDEDAVMVATNAFGMGIDKPNVRFVFHYDISDSVDSYYQEIGRAGRDGEPARALLFYRPEDLNLQKFFKGGGKVEEYEVKMVAKRIAEEEEPVDPEQLKEHLLLSERKIAKVINRLEEVGAVEVLPDGGVTVAADAPPDLDEAAKEATKAQDKRREWEQIRLERIRDYAELAACRRSYLLDYFGDESPGRCENCDNCQSGKTDAKPARNQAPFPPKTRVEHKEWGKGTVEMQDDDKLTVLFDDLGHRTLSIRFVLDRGLLDRVG